MGDESSTACQVVGQQPIAAFLIWQLTTQSTGLVNAVSFVSLARQAAGTWQ